MVLNNNEEYRLARERMVNEQIYARGIRDKRVLNAMLKIPRHLFVDKGLRNSAYSDHPLPIGEGQTISQPYIVALMTEALGLKGNEKVLEIGTGSGYQTAILAELCREVYTIERIPSLSIKAQKLLKSLGYNNIHFKIGDGTKGWEEHAPYDGIIVTAASPEVPQPYLDQLADGGRLVIPIGDEFSQDLLVIIKEKGRFREKSLGGCRFVKLIGDYGWKE